MCPTCHTTLDQSDSPIAPAHEALHRRAHRRGGTRRPRSRNELIGDVRAIRDRAGPSTHGFDLIAWLLPLVGLLGGARRSSASRAWRWKSRAWAPSVPGELPLDAEVGAPDRRRARALRTSEMFEPDPARLPRRPFASFVAPCVLPLVPGYLSAVSSLEARRFGEPGAARRLHRRQHPVRRRLSPRSSSCSGRSPARSAGVVDQRVFPGDRGLRARRRRPSRFARLLPLPQGMIAPSLLGRLRATAARMSCSAGHSAVCAAPCVSPDPRVRARARGRLEHGCAGRAAALRVLTRARRPVSFSRDSCSPRRWDPSAGSAIASTTSRSPADSCSSRSVCSSSSTACGGCGPASTIFRGAARRARAIPPATTARAPARPARARPRTSHASGVSAHTAVSRRDAFSSWRSQPTRLPRPAWYQATATWTRPWKKSRSSASRWRARPARAPREPRNTSPRRNQRQTVLEVIHTLSVDCFPPLRSCRVDDPAGGGRPLLPGEAGGGSAPDITSSLPTRSSRRTS